VLGRDLSFPVDGNQNDIADAWEKLPVFGGATLSRDGDIDTSPDNPTPGDGLTNHQEYRGFFWGLGITDPVSGLQRLAKVSVSNSNGLYQTDAYLPLGSTGHFRTHPLRKDVFLKFRNYSVLQAASLNQTAGTATLASPPSLQSGGPACGMACPFALGTALIDNAGLDLHVVNADTTTAGEQEIDVVEARNELAATYQGEDGHILKRGKRDWVIATLGDSGVGQDYTTYGVNTRTFQPSVTFFFDDAPYQDGGGAVGESELLESTTQTNMVEDKNDNGERDGGENSVVNDQILDGDRYLLDGLLTHDLSTFDIDKDGFVELPVVANPGSLVKDTLDSNESTRAQVTKHVLTHEVAHALGAPHTTVDTDLMFNLTTDFRRDGQFSVDAKQSFKIHND
jgi:hypothetical protein